MRRRGTPDASGAQRTYLDALLREAHANAYGGGELRGLASYRSGRHITAPDASHYIDALKAAKARGWLMPKPESETDAEARRAAIRSRVAIRRERSAIAASKMLRRGFDDGAAIERVRERLTWANTGEAQSRLSSLLRALTIVRDARAEFGKEI